MTESSLAESFFFKRLFVCPFEYKHSIKYATIYLSVRLCEYECVCVCVCENEGLHFGMCHELATLTMYVKQGKVVCV